MKIKDALFLFVLDAFHQVPRGAQTPSQGKKHRRMHPADFERISKFFLLSNQSYWDALPVAAIDDVRVKKEREKTTGTHGTRRGPFSSHLFFVCLPVSLFLFFPKAEEEKNHRSELVIGPALVDQSRVTYSRLDLDNFFDAIIGFCLPRQFEIIFTSSRLNGDVAIIECRCFDR